MVGVVQKNMDKSNNYIFHHGLIKLLASKELHKHSITWEDFLQTKGIPKWLVNEPQNHEEGFQ